MDPTTNISFDSPITVYPPRGHMEATSETEFLMHRLEAFLSCESSSAYSLPTDSDASPLSAPPCQLRTICELDPEEKESIQSINVHAPNHNEFWPPLKGSAIPLSVESVDPSMILVDRTLPPPSSSDSSENAGGRQLGCRKLSAQRRRCLTSEGRYKSMFCGYATDRKWDRDRHDRMVHTGERPYQCSLPGCTEEFGRPDALQKHIEKVHRTKPPQRKNR